MPLIEWNQSYSVKVPTLDEQHAGLIQILNELHQAMLEGKGTQAMAVILCRLGVYARQHLQTEEQMLEKYGYPKYAEHKAQHDAYVAKIHTYEDKLCAGEAAFSVELLNFLKQWWTSHIMTTDKQYSEFLHQKGAS